MSKQMQESDTAKTELASKTTTNDGGKNGSRLWLWRAIGLVFFGLLLLPFIFKSQPTTSLKTTDRTYKLSTVTSEKDKTLGLSGRHDLKADEGMIFIYDKPDVRCMWMKDMNFSIDMVWLGDKKQVQKIEHNVSPKTYPATFCAEKTRYVIELKAGEAKNAKIAVGDKLKI